MNNRKIRLFISSLLLFTSLFSTSLTYALHQGPTPIHSTQGANLITLNITPSINQLQTMNFYVGDSITLDLTKATIATGKIDSYYAVMWSFSSINSNFRNMAKYWCEIRSRTSLKCPPFPVAGNYSIRYRLGGNSTAAIHFRQIKINILPNTTIKPNLPPVAIASYPVKVGIYTSGKASNGNTYYNAAKVAFNASRSYDPDGTIIKYQWLIWKYIKSPTTNFLVVSRRRGPALYANFTEPGKYTVELYVTDNSGVTTYRESIINIVAFTKLTPPSPVSAILTIPPYVTAGTKIKISGLGSSGSLNPSISKYAFSYGKPPKFSSPNAFACNKKGVGANVMKTRAASIPAVDHIFFGVDRGLMDIFLTVTSSAGDIGTTCERITIH